jgi:hypothetical protein
MNVLATSIPEVIVLTKLANLIKLPFQNFSVLLAWTVAVNLGFRNGRVRYL